MSQETASAGAISREASCRRTFAIISHPDAGKTTLTEKFLLYSGWLRQAGTVRGRKGGAAATSDWMEMEKERGISITSSVLRIPFGDQLWTILDTPGHVDFSDDTYRTLTAAECAILVVDAVKGVEEQTRKLCEVCRLQRIPVLVFINKMDLEGRDPFDLMEEIEQELDLNVVPFNWPAGQGREFQGVVDRGLLGDGTPVFHASSRQASRGAERAAVQELALPSAEADALLGAEAAEELAENVALLDEAGNAFTREDFLEGRICPLFFGSALINFGLEPFLEAFADLAPSPRPRSVHRGGEQDERVDPHGETFSGYVYKIQSNMDPRHRDSLAFLRVCSGHFGRDEQVVHTRRGENLKKFKINRVYTLAAQDRETLDEAWPGDVVAIPNTGFAIGDTLSDKGGFWFPRLPQFTPGIFARVELVDLQKRKQYDQALKLLAVEGAILVLHPYGDNTRVVVAALGKLQLEVLEHRMLTEYGAKVAVHVLPYECSAWIVGEPNTFKPGLHGMLTEDPQGRLLALFGSQWEMDYAQRNQPEHEFRGHL